MYYSVYSSCHTVHYIRYMIILNSIIKQLNFDLHKENGKNNYMKIAQIKTWLITPNQTFEHFSCQDEYE